MAEKECIYKDCISFDACNAWIRHGTTLYDDYHFFVEDCPYYKSTADVVEVVRCKDCVNRVQFDTNKFHCELTGYYCGEMGYCSDAVRTPQKEG